MSGFCSAHQHHEPGCRQCEALSNDLVSQLREARESGRGNYGHRLLCSQAADHIEALRRSVDNLMKTVDAKQAKIDALMIEYCPGEMTNAQREEWARHQVVVDDPELISALQEVGP